MKSFLDVINHFRLHQLESYFRCSMLHLLKTVVDQCHTDRVQRFIFCDFIPRGGLNPAVPDIDLMSKEAMRRQYSVLYWQMFISVFTVFKNVVHRHCVFMWVCERNRERNFWLFVSGQRLNVLQNLMISKVVQEPVLLEILSRMASTNKTRRCHNSEHRKGIGVLRKKHELVIRTNGINIYNCCYLWCLL